MGSSTAILTSSGHDDQDNLKITTMPPTPRCHKTQRSPAFPGPRNIRTWPIYCWIFFLLGLGSRWTERDANLWNEILITYHLIIQTSSHNRDIKDDSLRQDRHDQMRGCPGSQQFSHFMIGSALLKFIMFKNVQY